MTLSARAIILAVLAVVAIAAVGYLVLGLLTGSSDHDTGGANSAPITSPTASPTASASVRPSAPATPSPSAPRTTAAPTITKVPASPPHALSIGTTISDAPFGSAVAPVSGRLIPDAPEQLQRLSDRGIPGSPGTDTVVLVGASSTSGRGALDGIDDVRTGAQIVLETQNARLTYKITSATDVDADQVLTLPAVTEKHTDRLVIDCAHYDDAHRVGSDRVLVATLVKAESMRP